MASKTQIANKMLFKVGAARTSNIETDPATSATIINESFDLWRDELLVKYPWNFAIKRTQLAKDADAPAWGFSNAYTLPSDYLHILQISGDPEYQIEGGKILTDEGAPLKIKYVYRVTSPGSFHPLFSEALAGHGAVEICERLTQSNTKKQILSAELERIVKTAFAIDAIENPPQARRDDEWLLSRESSVYYDDIDYNTTSS